LRAAGAEVMVGDLLEPADVYRVVNGWRHVWRPHPNFGNLRVPCRGAPLCEVDVLNQMEVPDVGGN
jgi:hypothetical protein